MKRKKIKLKPYDITIVDGEKGNFIMTVTAQTSGNKDYQIEFDMGDYWTDVFHSHIGAVLTQKRQKLFEKFKKYHGATA